VSVVGVSQGGEAVPASPQAGQDVEVVLAAVGLLSLQGGVLEGVVAPVVEGEARVTEVERTNAGAVATQIPVAAVR